MIDAACGLTRQIASMARAGRTAIHEVLAPQAVAEPWIQYPASLVNDPETGAGYFYHSHGPSRSHLDERGHFHLFVRNFVARHSHLVAIALNAQGMPVRLFATNRWVTDESWTGAEALLAHADTYSLAAVGSSAMLNLWITHCVQLFQPQMHWLLHRRDARLRVLASGRSIPAVFEDRRVEILSECEISLGQQIAALQAA